MREPIKKLNWGFTLVELLVVISVIGMLAGLVAANLKSAKQRAVTAQSQSFSNSIQQKIGIDLTGAWDFNEGSGTTAKDASGNNNNGTIIGGVSYSNDTSLGKGVEGRYSLDFNGGYVSVNNTLTNGYSALTIEAWFKTRPSGAYRTIISKG